MPLRPSFHDSSTRTAYCSMVSGCVVGSISTAICAPLRVSKAASFCSSADFCAASRVPVRSVTRALSGGTATSAPAVKGANSSAATSIRRNSARMIAPQAIIECSAYFAGAGTGVELNSTFGAVEMAFSFSTVNCAFSLKPKIIAVMLPGNCTTSVLYSCTALM